MEFSLSLFHHRANLKFRYDFAFKQLYGIERTWIIAFYCQPLTSLHPLLTARSAMIIFSRGEGSLSKSWFEVVFVFLEISGQGDLIRKMTSVLMLIIVVCGLLECCYSLWIRYSDMKIELFIGYLGYSGSLFQMKTF